MTETASSVEPKATSETQDRKKRALGNLALGSSPENKEVTQQPVDVKTLIADVIARAETSGDADSGEWFRFGEDGKTVRRIVTLGSGQRIIETAHTAATREHDSYGKETWGEGVSFETETQVPTEGYYKTTDRLRVEYLPSGALVEVPYDIGIGGNEGRVKDMIDVPASDPRTQQSRDNLHAALQAA